jgi:hypothetical protein
LRFFGEDITCAREFAAGHHGLLEEEALLAAMRFATANFVAGVTDRGIGIERRLPRPLAGGADACFRLTERGIVLPRGFESVLKTEEFRRTRFCLRAAQSWKFQCGRFLTGLVLHLHAGHRGLLLSRERRARKKNRDE